MNLKQIRLAVIILLGINPFLANANTPKFDKISLNKNWTLQPYGEWSSDGSMLLKPNVYSSKNAIWCNIPNTVLGTLVDHHVIKNPYFGDNLERVPAEWFKSQWKYSKQFNYTSVQNQYATLCFDGVNYAADVFLNGKKIASRDTMKGVFRRFEIDATHALKSGQNLLEVIIFPPQKGDFNIGFVDWTPNPTDNNMGLYRGVSLKVNGAVSIDKPFVKSVIHNYERGDANLTIETNVRNHSANSQTAQIEIQFQNNILKRTINLRPYESRVEIFAAQEFSALKLSNAKLWYPVGMGGPNLYQLKISSKVKGLLTDERSQSFGIRDVVSGLDKNGYRYYKINGKNYQIRGGGWTDDLFLREDPKNLEAQVKYTKLMNLNCIRYEGFWGASDYLYDLCDKEGLLMMVGLSCQWEWEVYVGKPCDEFGSIKSDEDIDLVAKSFADQVVWLRNHPSVFVWVFGSDMLPRPQLEKRYLSDLAVNDPTRPTLSSCQLKTSSITGSTGVKMLGPYDYVTPNYWYLDTKHGGAYGFNTETGPGPQIPTIETLMKMFPKDSIWPINSLWNYHSGRHEFNTINKYLNAMNERYGKSSNIDDFLRKAQLSNYEAIRPMFEAFAVNKANAGGIVQWMLNAPWPKLFWQLYDYYLTPNAAFFGTQNALKPLHLVYNYGDKAIYAINDFYTVQENLTAEIKVFNLNSEQIYTQTVALSMDVNSAKQIGSLPTNIPYSTVYFVDLKLKSADGKQISSDFYWLSTKDDELDFEKSHWTAMPNKSFADFTALQSMPKSSISVKKTVGKMGDLQRTTLTIKNTSNQIAFFLEMKLKDSQSGELILPVYWSDNYISLLPGETKTVTADVHQKKENYSSFVEIGAMNLTLEIYK